MNYGQLGSNLGQGSTSRSKLRGKQEFRELVLSHKASNFNFHVFKLYIECFWTE